MLAFELLQDKINGGFCGYGDEPSVFITAKNFIIAPHEIRHVTLVWQFVSSNTILLVFLRDIHGSNPV
jgi:hypothetical protein